MAVHQAKAMYAVVGNAGWSIYAQLPDPAEIEPIRRQPE
jgi:hypothetical protein